MDKTPQRDTRDPKLVEEARKGRGNYMNKLKESILNDAEKKAKILAMQATKLPMPLTVAPPPPLVRPQDPAMLISTALV